MNKKLLMYILAIIILGACCFMTKSIYPLFAFWAGMLAYPYSTVEK